MIATRYELAITRINAIRDESLVEEPFLSYFRKGASFLLLLDKVLGLAESGDIRNMTLDEHKKLNCKLYEGIVAESYDTSMTNPLYMKSLVEAEGGDKKLAQYLSFVASEIRGLIPYAFESNKEIVVTYAELFLEVYGMFCLAKEESKLPDCEELRQCLYWFERDNLELLVDNRFKEQVDPTCDFATKIIMEADLNDLRYLYWYGEYVTDNEIKLAEYINKLTEEEIHSMASTYTEGYRIGFAKTGKDLSIKNTVNVRYNLGFERMMREAIVLFEKMELKPVIYRAGSLSLNKKGQHRIGYYGAIPNLQYDYDHREDEAIYLDKDYVNRRMEVLKQTCENHKELAYKHAGPAVLEEFGEEPFSPKENDAALTLSKTQQKLSVEYASRSGKLINEYIKGEERSFTIISYPTPIIGEKFEEIFAETVKLNTLDYHTYENMQQKIIDILDTAETVHILGANGNETDLTVAMYELKDPATETIFENCVADVNIPVGEVFTSPKLKGTNGLLHVKQVFLEGLKYVDLKIRFKDGVISEYDCRNFEDDSLNKKYIKDNLLFHHETLPLGEFAIGTNTTAYRMARDYKIEHLLPILIGEKTGPHFAVGDTCYSNEEDIISYNPDGKKIVARSNDFSDLRKTDPQKAYFRCHTDITVPYDELGGIYAVRGNGDRIAVIEDGLFVVPGLEELNKPLKK